MVQWVRAINDVQILMVRKLQVQKLYPLEIPNTHMSRVMMCNNYDLIDFI